MASKGLSKEDTEQEHPLQAIVLCDAWGEEARWGPLVRRTGSDDDDEDEDAVVKGEQRPWCLLPLLNTPLLAWTLECLVSDGVKEAFLFVQNGIEEVREWLKTSSYSSAASGITVVLRPTTASTPGDVLREVDGLGILSPADFLVVQAGYVGNVDLAGKVAEFTKKRKEDPYLLMSCVVAPRKVATTSKLAVHVLSQNDQLLHYEESSMFPKIKQAMIPREALQGGKEVRTRSDLEAVGIAICNIEVPALFTENFDYQFFYPDFVNGILTSDLLDKTICCTIIGEETQEGVRRSATWAGVVGNTRSYDAVSKAILARRAYPLAPDENLPENVDRYEQRRGRVYYSKDLDLARTCTISTASLLGHGASVGERSTVTQSVLSPSSTIGASCTISGSYIFEGARIADGCSILNSVVGEGAVIGEGSIVEAGSLVGAGVHLGSGARLYASMVSKEEPEGEAQDGTILGEDHQGFLWPSEDLEPEEDEDDDDEVLDPRNLGVTRLGAQLQTLHVSSSCSSLSSLSRASSTTSLSSLAVGGFNTDAAEVAGIDNLAPVSGQSDFVSECTQSLDRSFAENHTVDNASIELKTLRMASNVPLGKVREVVIPYILSRCADAAAVPEMIKRWGGLIESLTGDQEEPIKDCLLTTQAYVAGRSGDEAAKVTFFLKVLVAYYTVDVITAEGVFAWYKSPASRSLLAPGGVRNGVWEDWTVEEERRLGRLVEWETRKRASELEDSWSGMGDDAEAEITPEEEPPDDIDDAYAFYSPPHFPPRVPHLSSPPFEPQSDPDGMELDFEPPETPTSPFSRIFASLISHQCPNGDCQAGTFPVASDDGSTVGCYSCGWSIGMEGISALDSLFEDHLSN
ncbi:hypothetical protein MNV49_002699 [Pseudohyphozyma bogoriensis]|nr:hypothetical protein MNV49_002699 [Pseudohyphozyma bogoriensis]